MRNVFGLSSDTLLVQFAFHVPGGMDSGYKAILVEGAENEDSWQFRRSYCISDLI